MKAERFKTIKMFNMLPIIFKVSEPNFKHLAILKIEDYIDDWEETFEIKDLMLWVDGENLEEIENNINEYLDEKTLNYNILSQNIIKNAYKYLYQ